MEKRKKKPKPGDVFRVRLDNGNYIYGRVSERGGYPFYNKQFGATELVNYDELLTLPVIFRIWVADRAFRAEKWEIVGRVEVHESIQDLPRFFIWDQIAKKFSIYNYEDCYSNIPSTYEECKELECAASWDSMHIESRLEDYFSGKPNKWLEDTKAKPV